jgi:hypothetical protein
MTLINKILCLDSSSIPLGRNGGKVIKILIKKQKSWAKVDTGLSFSLWEGLNNLAFRKAKM